MGGRNTKKFTKIGDTVYVRTSTLPFNTDISGLSDNATFG